jgi:hypothetical protein
MTGKTTGEHRMSDSRFRMKVMFEVYGQEFDWAPSLNWSAAPGECDERIASWFVDCYEKARGDFHAALFEAAAERTTAAKETADLAQLQAEVERLRAISTQLAQRNIELTGMLAMQRAPLPHPSPPRAPDDAESQA